MKKKTTQILAFIALIWTVGFSVALAQTVYTENYPNDNAAWTEGGIRGVVLGKISALSTAGTPLSSEDELIINVATGEHTLPSTEVGQGINTVTGPKITIVGAGASQTTLLPVNTNRLWIITNAGNTGARVTFKNLKLKNFGGTTGVGSGSVFSIGTFKLTFAFENVIFEGFNGRSIIHSGGAAVNYTPELSISIDNCLFINNQVSRSAGMPILGMVNINGGNLTVKNTTFMSTTINATNADLGGVLGISTPADGTTMVMLENLAFLNNRFSETSATTMQPIIAIKPNETSTETGVTISNLIAIGNKRDGSTDVDMYFGNYDKVNLNPNGVILNSGVKLVMDGETATYPTIESSGIKISSLYTYTHPDINFTMEGDLPKLTPDDKEIGKVVYTGDGGTPTSINMKESNPMKIYAFESRLNITGLNIGERIDIYTITGSVFTSVKANGNTFRMEMPKGIYIVKAGSKTQKVLIH